MSESRRRDEFGRLVDDGGLAPPTRRDKGKRRRRMYFKHFKVDRCLADPADRAAYERMLADPNTTVPKLRAFLLERGHNVSSVAVANHRIDHYFQSKHAAELAQVASAYCDVTRRYGPGAVSEAAHARFEIMLLQRVLGQPDAPQMPAEQWAALSRLIRRNVATRQDVEQLREDADRREKEAAEEARLERGRDETEADVVERVREILGVNVP